MPKTDPSTKSSTTFTIIDCYTDEPSGLGVPPYLSTYPRYIAGAILKHGKQNSTHHTCHYLTIDDLRLLDKGKPKDTPKTNIKIHNLSKNNPKEVLDSTDILIVVSGVQTPGKYLSAVPGTIAEVKRYIKDLKCKKILTGPAAMAGEGLWGGRLATTTTTKSDTVFDLVVGDLEYKFDQIIQNNFTQDIETPQNAKDYTQKITAFKNIAEISKLGAQIVTQHPDFPEFMIAEIETGRGCAHGKCSFCTEPIKSKFMLRDVKEIYAEMEALSKAGVQNFRIGKQSDFFSRNPKEIKWLLENVHNKLKPKVLHIDNTDPRYITEEKLEYVVKYCTPGNIAALGIESFDDNVVKLNRLNSTSEMSMNAIRLINKYGAKRSDNGMHYFLPGVNILFGLIGENKESHKINMQHFNQILNENLLLRRINIRECVAFPGTQLFEEAGMKYLKKNKKYYWKWRNEIRDKVDHEMLKRLMPIGTIMKRLRTEIHDGNTTFCRQIGTYPLIVGIKKRLPLNQWVDVKITGHMRRSLVGEVVV